jgi:hypothetical protein
VSFFCGSRVSRQQDISHSKVSYQCRFRDIAHSDDSRRLVSAIFSSKGQHRSLYQFNSGHLRRPDRQCAPVRSLNCVLVLILLRHRSDLRMTEMMLGFPMKILFFQGAMVDTFVTARRS